MRKIKKAPEKPPLSFIDKTIYVLLIILGFAMMFQLAWLSLKHIPMSIAFSEQGVVAAKNYMTVVFCSLPLLMSVGFFLPVAGGYGLKLKQPIFGNRRFVYPISRPVVRMHPIFSRDFWKNLKKSQNKDRKIYIRIIVISVIVRFSVFPFGLFARTTLNTDGYFSSYNVFNVKTNTINIEDAQKLVINIDWERHKGSRTSYFVELIFHFDDAKYSFRTGDFYEMSYEETLEYMLSLKQILADRYEITNSDRMARLMGYGNFNEKEVELVYELFDYN